MEFLRCKKNVWVDSGKMSEGRELEHWECETSEIFIFLNDFDENAEKQLKSKTFLLYREVRKNKYTMHTYILVESIAYSHND